jgi:hypothetical protein
VIPGNRPAPAWFVWIVWNGLDGLMFRSIIHWPPAFPLSNVNDLKTQVWSPDSGKRKSRSMIIWKERKKQAIIVQSGKNANSIRAKAGSDSLVRNQKWDDRKEPLGEWKPIK